MELPSWVKVQSDAESTAEIAILLRPHVSCITDEVMSYAAACGIDFKNRFHDRDWDDGAYIETVHAHFDRFLKSQPLPSIARIDLTTVNNPAAGFYGYAPHREDLPEWAVPGDAYVVAELGLLLASFLDRKANPDSREPIRYIVDMAEAFYRAHPTADWDESYIDVLGEHFDRYVRDNPRSWLHPLR